MSMGSHRHSLKRQWLQGSLLGVVLQGLGLALAFGSSVLLARMLGPAGLGQYGYVLAIVAVASVFATMGLATVVARLLAGYQAKDKKGLARGLLHWAGRRAGWVSLLFAACLTAYGHWQAQGTQFWLYFWAAWLIPLLVLTALRQRALQAMHHPVAAQLPEQLVKHVVFLGLAGALLLVGNPLPGSAEGVMFLWMIAVAASFVVGNVLLWRMMPNDLRQGSREYDIDTWRRIAGTLFLADVLGVLLGNSDTILLGVLSSPEEVGIYQVALRLSGLLLVLLGASNWVLAPWFSRFHALDDRERFQTVVTRSTRAVFMATLVIFAVMVVAGRPLLELFFGEEFQQAYPLLLLLGAGQLVNVASGPVVNLLSMSGGQKALAVGVGAAAVANILLCSLLIPVYGALGAAISVALVTSGYNLWLVGQVRHLVGIRATILG